MHIERQLSRWREEGLIAAEQATAILAFEGRNAAGSVGAADEARTANRRLRVAEALGYVGGATALAAALVLVGEQWARLTTSSQASLLAVVALALLAAGRLSAGREAPALRRLASGLLLGSVIAVAALAALLTSELTDASSDAVALVTGLVTTVYGGALWHRHPTGLTQLGMGGGVLTATLASLHLLEPSPGDTTVSLVVWGLGVIWFLLAWAGVLRPRPTGTALGATTALLAAQTLAFEAESGGLALGMATAVALVVASVVISEVALLGLGVAGGFLFVAQTVARFVGDALGVPLGLLLFGLGLVGAAAVVARLRPLASPD